MPLVLCGCAAHMAASQGGCSPLGADFQACSIHSTWVMQSDPSTPRYGKGKQGSPGFLGYCCLQVLLLQVCNQHRIVRKFLVWSLGNGDYRECRACQGVLQSLFFCCSYTWSLHNSVLLLLGSTISCLVICGA